MSVAEQRVLPSGARLAVSVLRLRCQSCCPLAKSQLRSESCSAVKIRLPSGLKAKPSALQGSFASVGSLAFHLQQADPVKPPVRAILVRLGGYLPLSCRQGPRRTSRSARATSKAAFRSRCPTIRLAFSLFDL